MSKKHQSINRQIVTVMLDCNVAGNRNFQYPINLRFEADEVILKQITYSTTEAAASRTYIIQSTLTLDPYMGSFPAQTWSVGLNQKFKLNKWQQGSPYFYICELQNATSQPIVTTNAVGKLAITLEFLQNVSE